MNRKEKKRKEKKRKVAFFSSFEGRLTPELTTKAQWFGKGKSGDINSGPFAHPHACLKIALTHWLAPHCFLRPHAPLCLVICLIVHLLASYIIERRFMSMNRMHQFHTVSNNSAWVEFTKFQPTVHRSISYIFK